ncbi:hypothetical protein AQPE_0617 [Aquipluma nitroreducens]|uniref:Uncharacterized protein n=1 Tax=Aquipluma nitroreducens TaxID=2010828 RepID=A0A5K7S4I9_9BACT|nr:hypothetical protein AQPE_0617 [Aquipluma nitroreducens]
MIFVFSHSAFFNRDSSQLFLFFIPEVRNRRNKRQSSYFIIVISILSLYSVSIIVVNKANLLPIARRLKANGKG